MENRAVFCWTRNRNLKEGRASCRNLKEGISDNEDKNGGHTSEKNLLQKVSIAGKEKGKENRKRSSKEEEGCEHDFRLNFR